MLDLVLDPRGQNICHLKVCTLHAVQNGCDMLGIRLEKMERAQGDGNAL